MLTRSQTLDQLGPNDNFFSRALYLLIKLSTAANILPTSLFVRNVDIGRARDPWRCGAFADIFRGHYGGCEVVVKKLRFFSEGRAHAHRVSRVSLSEYSYHLMMRT
jgi:hypothetical protein